jgi:choline kinase/phosphatidylglycerophosphate synthase
MATTGLIIAAGMGSRLADQRDIPKPLRVVAGLTLLRRIVLLAARAGLTRIVVVVGYQKEKIISYVSAQSWPIVVECVENPEWQKSNGVSVLAAQTRISENFILLMSDHIFESDTLRDLRELPLTGIDAALAVDYKIDTIFDMPDATKVKERDGKILSIGKSLTDFNCIDTGMFLMTPQIFAALKRAQASKGGDCSLSDGIAELSAAGRMAIFNIGKRYWQDVDTPEGYKEAERVLMRSCRKDTDGFFSRHFNRYVSLAISKQLLKTQFTPNQMTVIFFFLTGIPAAILAAFTGYWAFLAATFLFQWGSILDGVDGEVARLKFLNSKFGQWLDTACDNGSYLLFFIGTAIGVYRAQPTLPIKILIAAALFGLITVLGVAFYTLSRKTQSGTMLAISAALEKRIATSKVYAVLAKLQFIIRRDFFAVLFLVFGVLGKPLWVIIGLALVANIGWLAILDLSRGMNQNTP